ncbi:hypothetical protein FQR65_LT18195 [Abscondita terminalis]|nr:hypothetical protein FQR65_LT18195 [Abscondita terminalis]
MVCIGLYAYRKTTDFSDYILGGRSLGSFVTALSAGASDMSGWLLMGLPGAIYLTGLSESWIAIGLIIGAWLNWYLVAGRLRVHTEVQNNALTLPDYFTSRFGDKKKVLRIISALVILIFFGIYCASGMVAGARLFESIFAMNYTTALWVSAIATISYVCIGGFLAISWTDTFQAGLMIFALLLAPIMTFLALVHVAVGYVGIAYFQAHPDIPSAAIVAKNPETVFMELTKILFNPWIAGVVLAAILAAVMSTLSCQLLVCSSTLTEDLYKSFIRKKASQTELVWVGRLMVLAISVLAIILAFNPESKVLGLVAYAWAGFGAAFGPLILLSVFWKRMTLNGALVGIIVGAVTVIVWKNTMAATGLYEIIPGFIFSLISIIVVSLLGKAPEKEVTDRFDDAEQIYDREMKNL